MGKGLNIYQFRSIKTPSFILPVQVLNSVIGTPEADTRFFYKNTINGQQLYLIF